MVLVGFFVGMVCVIYIFGMIGCFKGVCLLGDMLFIVVSLLV